MEDYTNFQGKTDEKPLPELAQQAMANSSLNLMLYMCMLVLGITFVTKTVLLLDITFINYVIVAPLLIILAGAAVAALKTTTDMRNPLANLCWSAFGSLTVCKAFFNSYQLMPTSTSEWIAATVMLIIISGAFSVAFKAKNPVFAYAAQAGIMIFAASSVNSAFPLWQGYLDMWAQL